MVVFLKEMGPYHNYLTDCSPDDYLWAVKEPLMKLLWVMWGIIAEVLFVNRTVKVEVSFVWGQHYHSRIFIQYANIVSAKANLLAKCWRCNSGTRPTSTTYDLPTTHYSRSKTVRFHCRTLYYCDSSFHPLYEVRTIYSSRGNLFFFTNISTKNWCTLKIQL